QLNVQEDGFIQANNISFKDCSAEFGGGLYSDIKYGGKLSISGISSFQNCQSLNGGGIYSNINSEGQLIIMNQCIFTECKATSGSGGGIYSNSNENGQLLLNNQCKFYQCVSNGGNGGGIYININFETEFAFIINDSIFQECQTLTNSSLSYSKSGFGGGIFLTGNGNYNPTSERIDLEGMKMYQNSADKGGSSLFVAMSELKELCQYGTDGQYIKGNYSDTDSDEHELEGSEINGGAIYLNMYDRGQVTISNSTFNQCEGVDGGAIYIWLEIGQMFIDGQCNFTQCKASHSGGGIAVNVFQYSNFTLEDGSKFENCTSYRLNTYYGGGGIYIGILGQGTGIINNVQFIYCDGSSGGGLKFSGSGLMKQIFNRTQFANCEAQNEGGGMFNYITGTNCILELIGVIFENCSSFNAGGGIYVDVRSVAQHIISETCQFKDCYASNRGGGYYLNCQHNGTHIEVSGQLEFENCSANSGGGMQLNVQEDGFIQANNISFKDCSAEFGGGLYSDIKYGGKLSISGLSSFQNCQSSNGGGIYSNINSEGQLIIMNQCIFTECKATSGSGGGIYSNSNENGQLLLNSQCKFYQCVSNGGNGGGIYININFETEFAFIINDAIFQECQALTNSSLSYSQSGFGGGIFLTGNGNYNPISERIDLEGMKMYQNSADKGGSSLFVAMNELKELCQYGTDGQYIKGNYSDTDSDEHELEGIAMQLTQFNSAQQTQIDLGKMILEEYWKLPFELIWHVQYRYQQQQQQQQLIGIDQYYCGKIEEPCQRNAIQSSINGPTGFLQIQDSQFIQCKGSDIDGGAILLFVYNGGQVTISNSTFDQCEAFFGGGIYVTIQTDGKITIDGQCNFTQCKASYSGGGIYASISGLNSQFILEDELKYEGCLSQYSHGGGGIYVDIQDQGVSIINKVQFNYCNANNGGGIYILVNQYNEMKQIFNGTQFTNCEAQQQGGGMYMSLQQVNSILELIDLSFENCHVLGDFSGGGGIFVQIFEHALLLMSETCLFKNCSSGFMGGGYCMICEETESNIQITGYLEFENCSSKSGGGMFVYIDEQATVNINQISFKDCSAQSGGGLMTDIKNRGKFSISGISSFLNCESLNGGGIYSNIDSQGQLIIINQSIFTECKSISGSGGGIYSYLYEGTINIEDTTFDRCTCTQPGNGGGIALYQGSSSIISITNSSFIDCKTISNTSDQRYGWGGAIFIQTSVTAENLNETNFLMRDLIFSGCSALNQLGNNIHIQSFDTYATGEAIKNGSLLTVKDIPDLYENKLYGADYMGIDESDVDDGNTLISKHEPLFNIPQSRMFLNSYLVDANDGIDNVFCGESDMPCNGGIYIEIMEENSGLNLTTLSFENCSRPNGGGLTIFAQDGPKFSINGKTTFKNCSSNSDGGGFNTKCNNTRGQILMTGQLEFEKCTSNRGGGMYILSLANAIIIVNQLSFKDCSSSGQGGGLYVYSFASQFNVTGQSSFLNCKSQIGGGCFQEIQGWNAVFFTNNSFLFDNCTSQKGSGIYSKVYNYGTISQNSITINDCTALFGGGIFLEIDNGTFKIDGATFNGCDCTQPGNGGGIDLIHKPSSIISITNSSFINCKTISNSSDQRYGWGGAIFIQTSVIATQLSSSNFLMKNLVFSGCSAVNSIGNNLHIQSIDTYATGLAIKNGNLLTVKDLSNPPNIISDLYTSSSYSYDFMGINQSIETNNLGTINLDLHNPLFEQLFTSNVPNPTFISSINGKDIKYCGGIQTICKTIQYSINRNPNPFSETPPPDINYSIILTSNTELDTNIQITSTTLLNRQIIIQSDGYSSEAEEDNYTKYSIITSSFSTSLFTITETGHLSLLGLHFENLEPSSTTPLILLTNDDNNQIPVLSIIDCEFNQNLTPDPIPNLSHSIISINGGQM
ncbi:MAG: hypothetical protein EZS28_016442, partial [Streblomastix strix]